MSEYDEFRYELSELVAKLSIHKAQVLADPEPHLMSLKQRCVKLLKALDDIEQALSPVPVRQWAEDHGLQPYEVYGEALIRCNAALKVIQKYKYPS